MKITFSEGDIIATQHEIVVRLKNNSRTTIQAEIDSLTIIAWANVIIAVGRSIKWALIIDDEIQLKQLSQEIGIAIEFY